METAVQKSFFFNFALNRLLFKMTKWGIFQTGPACVGLACVPESGPFFGLAFSSVPSCWLDFGNFGNSQHKQLH